VAPASHPSHGWGHRFNPCRAHQITPLKYQGKPGKRPATLADIVLGTCREYAGVDSTMAGTAKRGRVYFIQSGAFIKIGYTADVPTRLSAIKASSPLEITLIGTVAGTFELEAQLHERFKADHHRGEWFHATADVYWTAVELCHPNGRTTERVAVALEDPIMAAIRGAAPSLRTRVSRGH
jgi:hypothetical protein